MWKHAASTLNNSYDLVSLAISIINTSSLPKHGTSWTRRGNFSVLRGRPNTPLQFQLSSYIYRWFFKYSDRQKTMVMKAILYEELKENTVPAEWWVWLSTRACMHGPGRRRARTTLPDLSQLLSLSCTPSYDWLSYICIWSHFCTNKWDARMPLFWDWTNYIFTTRSSINPCAHRG